MDEEMATIFIGKKAFRGTIKTCSVSSFLRDHNNSARSVAVTSGNKEKDKPKEEAMGTTTDGKAPNVTLSHAGDREKDGLKQAIHVATKEHGDASKPNKNEGDEETVAVGENGTVKGENQSSG